jgi:hypothetical protein
VVKNLAVFALLLATGAAAQELRSMEGMGRVSVQGGYKWAPNAPFVQKADEAGHTLEGKLAGGPQFSASFGYAALDWVEATIDLLIGFENFTLKDYEPFASTTYGALLGVRLAKMDFPIRGLVPHLGAQFGPVLSFITSKSINSAEKLNTAYSLNAGLTWRFKEKWGVGFDARYVFATGEIPGAGPGGDNLTINAGGLWVSLTLVYFIGPGPKDPLGGML